MKFIREIGIANINDVVINKLDQEGFTLVWKEDSVELWYQAHV